MDPCASVASESDASRHGWQRDEDVQSCPRCATAFTTSFRRHHCRNCGDIVCDDCSRHRVRLPGTSQGKARVCDTCMRLLNDHQATALEEDLDVNAQIIAQLRGSLALSYSECEAFKRVLLELDTLYTGDTTLVTRYQRDPQSDAYNFSILRDRVTLLWSELKTGLEARPSKRQEFLVAKDQACQRRDEAKAVEQELAAQRAELDAALGQVAKAAGQRDEFVRKTSNLEEALRNARQRVTELERERQERLSGSVSNQAESAPPGSRQALPFTISGGRQDPLLGTGAFSDRLQSCRRSCAVM